MEKIISKIHKLFELANSDNQHEATLAMEKANQLLVKYNLQMADISKEEKSYSDEVVAEEPYLRIHQKFILPIMKSFFFIDVFLGRKSTGKYSKAGQRLTKTEVVFCGTKENIKIAHYTYDFLCQAFQSLWLTYKKEKNLSENKRQHFYQGLAAGIVEKLTISKQSVENEMGLVVVPDDGLMDYMGSKSLRSSTNRRPRADAEHAEAGANVGRSLNLRKGLGGKSTNSGKSIGHK